ncbi:Neprilysin {ECO:0000269/PubMed:15283675, ECO:0000269/PubMed:8168535}; AltName: Full=Atriopeptidase; AltName: Full=Common acute lymphocytic leukemia antigen; Short=CALLA; AltName: Full=Enkephalinase; AltName: Full=Neutral endopeptidase 24.11; Short=NEP; Short=Neutral endopeptidase; AltName: Full=Skin fibroblast elastase; Short=SFE; AltName: CD_antigen=CD10 [Serendipita indica DSM 11827]|nr:Neprilysin {ECO:0000269/PubMed:15283675, ECO:0000269/PubMed:8168535}; AltName: Full=Atriopeptidase; AltName: Full=Common acute lymphocytic leukemia antigen; Short=CALLA; AltName: Full=Enkephalinase; AltName: Full=Neutral endopeptidase 24.11; Short=NEP; Short=Neutral endopeptidase; AltName: Full=Skin fibroblast elastase; Short=SFE; AltName: CD_antigen=CD10 [Serendipita indica DSM 11827]
MSAPAAPADVGTSSDEDEQSQAQDEGFFQKLADIAEQPLTTLTKVLLGVCLFLLLLLSVFVGLFAGAQHKINHKPSPAPPSVTPTTVLTTVTETLVSTKTSIFTTTVALPAPTGEPTADVCTSSDCIILSASILSSIDTSFDPCEDFYLYTNNGWLKSHPIPSDKGSFGNFEDVQLQNEAIIREILEAPSPKDLDLYDRKSLQKVKALYGECLAEDKLDKVGMAPLLDTIRVVRGLYNGSTSIDPHFATQQDGTQRSFATEATPKGLTAALAYLHSRGVGALFGFDIDGDIGVDPDKMTLWFWQPELGLPSKEYYEEPEISKVYEAAIEKLLFTVFEEEKAVQSKQFWPPFPWPQPPKGGDDDEKPENSTVRAKRLAKSVFKFEQAIARASQDLDELYDPIGSYNPVPFSNLTEGLPQIQFDNYLTAFAPRSFPSRVIVTYPAYITSLSAILDDAKKEDVEAYLIARTILSLAPLLGQDTYIWKVVRELREVLGGLKKGALPDRSEYCAKVVSEVLGYATGRFFVHEAFGGESKKKASNVITNVIEAFKTSLPHLSWMDKNSSTAAAEKAIGYPLWPNTESSFQIYNFYKALDPSANGYFATVLAQETWDQIRKWQKLGRARNHMEWEMFASTVNAYYNPPAQEIVFPAGIMRPPWFSVNWPGYLNYGGMGAIAAHELCHAFDSAGRMYNQHGKLEEWWTNTTSQNFDKIQKCISKQYSEYTIDDGKGNKVHVNGELTSGENIADQGLINSYRAWKANYNSSYEQGSEYLLPGLNYTREQLFFISFGRTWARNMRPASAVQRIRTDPHSPTQFRVDGTLSDIPEFAQAFNCSTGSKLNPPKEKQCRLWS